jgi:hypothetical protein
MKRGSHIFHGFVTLGFVEVRFQIFTNLSRNLNIPGRSYRYTPSCKAAFALVVPVESSPTFTYCRLVRAVTR